MNFDSIIVVGIILIPLKTGTFYLFFKKAGESSKLSQELAVRLSQSSEFSLLVAASALSAGIISSKCAMMIQVITIVTFILSTYFVVKKFPTPISNSSILRRD